MRRLHATLTDRLLCGVLALLLLAGGMPQLRPIFVSLFPDLERPLYVQESFLSLVVAHVNVVLISSFLSLLVGVLAGVFVTRESGKEFRPLVETLIAIGQTFPPVAVLAVAAPLIGFGLLPAVIAFALYGLLPIAQGTIAGIESVPRAVLEAAEGIGMTSGQCFLQVELPLALPVIISGVRTSVVINIGTAAIASTVGAKTLGSPIIVGLSGFNTAYVIQGALLVGLLAIVVDLAFEKLLRYATRWESRQLRAAIAAGV